MTKISKKQNSTIVNIALTGLMGALVYVATMFFKVEIPVGADRTMIGFANVFNKLEQRINRKKLDVYSGTIPNHHCKIKSASNIIGRQIISIRKNEILELALNNWCMCVRSPTA